MSISFPLLIEHLDVPFNVIPNVAFPDATPVCVLTNLGEAPVLDTFIVTYPPPGPPPNPPEDGAPWQIEFRWETTAPTTAGIWFLDAWLEKFYRGTKSPCTGLSRPSADRSRRIAKGVPGDDRGQRERCPAAGSSPALRAADGSALSAEHHDPLGATAAQADSCGRSRDRTHHGVLHAIAVTAATGRAPARCRRAPAPNSTLLAAPQPTLPLRGAV